MTTFDGEKPVPAALAEQGPFGSRAAVVPLLSILSIVATLLTFAWPLIASLAGVTLALLGRVRKEGPVAKFAMWFAGVIFVGQLYLYGAIIAGLMLALW